MPPKVIVAILTLPCYARCRSVWHFPNDKLCFSNMDGIGDGISRICTHFHLSCLLIASVSFSFSLLLLLNRRKALFCPFRQLFRFHFTLNVVSFPSGMLAGIKVYAKAGIPTGICLCAIAACDIYKLMICCAVFRGKGAGLDRHDFPPDTFGIAVGKAIVGV